MPVRDSQRARVYESETLLRTMIDRADAAEAGRSVEIAGSTVTLPVERRFASIESVQTYVDAVLALEDLRRRYPRASRRCRVRARAGQGAAHYEHDAAVIAVPLHVAGHAWAMRELVVLHEIAHHLEDRDPETTPHAAHGPEFTARLLDLLDRVVGPEAAFVLRCIYGRNDVRVG
ncbi:TIGR04338 family metallohydrolase [Rhodococcoides kroppenstedtii]|uniref:TIGR04338 family metallohydrolase n=1 Tax=Rhodococcoides kroppenstedtii TaxID=293050 RepID=UPI001BDEF5B7|nr:TIGR04338 family metallohydrolase [Rhodococcus kroppenstedtii]MBT1190540.1 TIGR04338 family metallohydrolase [Rhodococcus kroppenstedtii]